MKRKLQRIISIVVLMSMISMDFPALTVYAADVASTSMEEVQEQGVPVQSEGDEEINQIEETNEIPETEDEPEANEDDYEEISEEDDALSQNDGLNYVYLGSTYVETPGVQNIVISWGDGTENVTSADVYYRDDSGNEWSIPCSEQRDNTYLFSKEFTEHEAGIYRISRVEMHENDEIVLCDIEREGITAIFGVNQEYQGDEVSEHLDMESLEESETTTVAESSIVALSEDGEEAVESISQALDITETQATQATISSKAMLSSRSKDLVIVLDPGHDASHTGARNNGVQEEVATLKIAKYCKEELDTYAGVTVYMTRESSACPYPETIGTYQGNIADIKKRVQWAKTKGADVFISFHLNSSTNTGANGAQVFYPEASYAGNDIANQGAALSNKIQQELLKLGLAKRVNDDADYAVNTESAKCGFPGIIIEHAFVSNVNDVNNYLNSDEKLRKLGIADATGIANYYGLSKEGKIANILDGTYVINTSLNDKKCITAESGKIENGTAVSISTNKKNSQQRFEIVGTGDGYYKILCESSGLALDVPGASTNSKVRVQLYEWNNSDAQKWKFIDAGDGAYYIRSALGKYLNLKSADTSDGNIVWMYTNDKTKACKWNLVVSDNQLIENGTYEISSGLNVNKVVDVWAGSINNGANVQLYEKNDSAAQRYEIKYVGKGYYKIYSEKSGKALDVTNGSKQSGANVQQWTSNGNSAQLWKFVDAGDGYYYIKSILGTTLDVCGGKTANGTNIDVYSVKGTKAQKWRLRKTEVKNVPEGAYAIRSRGNQYKVLTSCDGKVKLNTYGNWSEQKYNVVYNGNGYYSIRNMKTGKFLGVADAALSSGVGLQEYEENKSSVQLWKFIDAGNGYYYLKSDCGMYVDTARNQFSDGTSIQMSEISNKTSQMWKIDSKWGNASEKPVESGNYNIQLTQNKKKVLDVAAASTANGANVQLYDSNNTLAQNFSIEYVGNGNYKILSELSGKSLDILAGSARPGANIQIYDWNGTKAQLWRFVEVTDNSYYIVSQLGTVIDLSANQVRNGTNIDAYELNGTKAQMWSLKEINGKNVPEGKYVIANYSNNLEVVGVSGDNIQLQNFDNIASQKYEIKYVGNGYYRIVNTKTNKVLQANGNKKNISYNVIEAVWNGADNQLWKFVMFEGGYYIKSKLGTYIDVSAGNIKNGSNIQTYFYNGTNAQKWVLKADWAKYSEGKIIENGTYYFTSCVGGKVLDVSAGSRGNGANVQVYTKNNTSAQRWEIYYVGDGYYKIRAEHSDKALDVAAGSNRNGTNVQQYEWNGTNAQLWRFIPSASGGYYIKSKLGTYLDVYAGSNRDGANVQTYELNGTKAQQWKLVDSDYAPFSSNHYVAFTKKDATLVMDVASASTKDGANLQLYTYNGTNAQLFKVQYNGKGYYKLIATHSNKVLTVENDSQKDGANIVQSAWASRDGQLWKFVSCEDGTYYIKSKLGTVIEVESPTLKCGANLQAGVINNESWQKWGIYDPDAMYEIMGNGFTTVKQMAAFYRSRNSNYPYANSDAPTIEDFCRMYIEECQAEGVKSEVAFCQAMLETGFLKYGGDVKAEQYNFAGIGAVGGGVSGASFNSVRTGIRAQVQHLKAYASTDKLKNGCVDPRFSYVKRGSARYVEWLGIQENPNKLGWAAGKNYGNNITKLIRNLKAY